MLNLIRGALWGAKGTQHPPTSGASGALRVNQAHGQFFDATYDHRCFHLDSDAVTLAAANTTKGALGTVKLVNGFWNPVDSGWIAIINDVKIGTVSGTPAGPLYFNYINTVIITTARSGTVQDAWLGGSGGSSSAMSPMVNVALVERSGLTTALQQLCLITGPAAITAGAGINSGEEVVQGRIIVPPGCVFGITATGAGTNHIVQSTISWEEIKLPN